MKKKNKFGNYVYSLNLSEFTTLAHLQVVLGKLLEQPVWHDLLDDFRLLFVVHAHDG